MDPVSYLHWLGQIRWGKKKKRNLFGNVYQKRGSRLRFSRNGFTAVFLAWNPHRIMILEYRIFSFYSAPVCVTFLALRFPISPLVDLNLWQLQCSTAIAGLPLPQPALLLRQAASAEGSHSLYSCFHFCKNSSSWHGVLAVPSAGEAS